MPKVLSLAHNSLAVLGLVAIISLSLITTLSLSPVALQERSRVAGAAIQDAKILSNFIPLSVSDLNDPSQLYTSQLVQNTQSQYKYHAAFLAREKGVYEYELVAVENPNSAPVYLKVSAVIPQDIQASLNITVQDENTKYQIHSADQTGRLVEFEIPAQTSVQLTINYELVQSISFPFNVSFALEY
jgi:hypothetical protein